eukprot:CAMPEP_0197623408 /NCGR_PEP_ID=MMETSP1338-20131121/3426_1 /TAXON_ID=43686 ORGANISM="Pelagodinium beii, Strain RCC1491" /NCGR_SAMPLE_ID=MMETSP1338 /ASSEMBLY_ACC=CAM_ASM_000754 /LENGTH=384 /DNA_ID=CAMNT_0043193379 /DNA_START=33 /DNA_END=1187 /DNA_ORIENTATION=-
MASSKYMDTEHERLDGGHRDMWHKVNAAVVEANASPLSTNLPLAPVPEIDISCFVAPEQASDADRELVVQQVLSASQSLGFMNIIGHGVPHSLVDSVLCALRSFFESSVELKQQCIAKSMHGTFRGYTPFRFENHNAALGRPGPSDRRELYSFGPAQHQGGSAFGENTYPEFVDGFQHFIEEYYAECERLEKVLLEIFTLALAKSTGQSLDPQYLQHQIRPNRGLLAACWYPACEPSILEDGASSLEDGVSGHTDWGPLTILLTTSPGLEVCIWSQQEQKHQWRSVPVVPGAFTINVADQLARWSNDRFVSCVHRVNTNHCCQSSRISIPYFSTQVLPLTATDEPKVGCICAEGEVPKYEPLSIRGYLQQNCSRLQHAGRNAGA